jgi:hypothetical protein
MFSTVTEFVRTPWEYQVCIKKMTKGEVGIILFYFNNLPHSFAEANSIPAKLYLYGLKEDEPSSPYELDSSPGLPHSSSTGGLGSRMLSAPNFSPSYPRQTLITDMGRSESTPNFLAKSAESVTAPIYIPYPQNTSSTLNRTYQTLSPPSTRRTAGPLTSSFLLGTSAPSSSSSSTSNIPFGSSQSITRSPSYTSPTSHLFSLSPPESPTSASHAYGVTPKSPTPNSTPQSSPSVASTPPVFLGCIDYYPMIPASPVKSAPTTPTKFFEQAQLPTTPTKPPTTPTKPPEQAQPPTTPTKPPEQAQPIVPTSEVLAPATPEKANGEPNKQESTEEVISSSSSSPASKPKEEDVESGITANLTKAKPIKTKSASAVTPSSSRLAKSPSLSSASSSSIMSPHASPTKSLSPSPNKSPSPSPTSSVSGSPSTSPSISRNKKQDNTTSIPASPSPVLPSFSNSQSPVHLESLKQEMVSKLQDISAFLRANMDTASRNVEYMMGLAQILTYMKKVFVSFLFSFRILFSFLFLFKCSLNTAIGDTSPHYNGQVPIPNSKYTYYGAFETREINIFCF